jgi:DnaA-homolog protein
MPTSLDSEPTLYQLPLPFYLQEKFNFENFCPGSNTVVLTCLQRLIKEKSFTHSVYLWGHRFVGCSHLLKASCEAAKQAGMKALYLSLKEGSRRANSLDLHEIAKRAELVCIDDIDVICGDLEWEKALFFIYNDLAMQGIPVIYAAHQVPHKLSLQLPDLVSRLNSGLLFQVHELNDAEKISALQLRAKLRGLELSEPIARFLLSRLPRSPRVLLDTLNQLDKFALAYQRKLTMPFVKEVLNL